MTENEIITEHFDKDGRRCFKHIFQNGKTYYTWSDWSKPRKLPKPILKIKINSNSNDQT